MRVAQVLTKPLKKVPPPVSGVHKTPVLAGLEPVFEAKEAIYSVVTPKKVFALTFDDGPDPTYTPQVLALLKQYDVPATFFMVGSMVHAHPATALQVLAAGFPIGNHSWSHPRAPKFPVAEVERTDAIIKATLGTAPTLFRPPYGLIHNGMAQAARKEGEQVIIWSCLGADWDKKNTPAKIAAKVLGRAHSGGIALLHDGGGNRTRTLAALPRIIETLQARGFQLVTVPELLKMGAPQIAPSHTPSPIPAPTFSPAPLPVSHFLSPHLGKKIGEKLKK